MKNMAVFFLKQRHIGCLWYYNSTLFTVMVPYYNTGHNQWTDVVLFLAENSHLFLP